MCIRDRGDAAGNQVEALKAALESMCGLEVEMTLNQPFVTTSGGKARVIISRLEDDHGS